MEHPRTDTSNARLYASMHKDKVRYDLTSGKWLAWDGRRWSKEHGESRAQFLCRDVTEFWFKQLNLKDDRPTRDETYRWWQYTASAGGVQHLLYMAKSEPGIVVTHDQLDRDIYLLNVLDGTIDMRTGKWRSHNPNDLITQLANVKYLPEKEEIPIPKWEKSLKDWHPRGDIDGTWDYLQELFGLCCTGDIGSRFMGIWWGDGFNGKNGCLDTLMFILGDYATPASRTLINARQVEQHPTEIACLWKKRLVIASEPERGNALKVGLVKSLTGDNVIQGRFMRQDFFKFMPTHKLIMLTQHLPGVQETNNAIWDRLHKLPWLTRIPKENQIPNYSDVYLRDEWPGILRWAIQGYLRMKGKMPPVLGPTKLIEHETLDYRNEQNPAKKFVDGLFVVAPGLFVDSGTVNRLFSSWIGEWTMGENMPTKGDLDRYLRDLGCTNKTHKREGKVERGWFGIGLKAIS